MSVIARAKINSPNLELTKEMVNSMCESVYENIHAERVNGTIKNQYLKGYNPGSFE